ncbi:acylglycerol kinase, mitochondrial isoform X2 [Panulirus ornatus]|uniref:acylglycerol kinase, mitochondrial isoform X2 n=1 Tax=Panulirus ornatus TaxID=150431 RepID=UPI003A8968BD
MSRIIKFFNVLRRNPKKSIFFSALLAGGINFVKSKYEEKQIMRAFCEEAMLYGECSKPLGEPDRHVTVLLNPAAKNGKGKIFFDRYCAPLLYLAGIKVAIVKTEHEGQARDLMEIMDNTSAVVVAGGDGTLGEVLTGLLRRVDHIDATQKLPLGILPLGSTNTAMSAVWGFRGNPKPQHLAAATMAIVHDIKRPLDVMEITPLQNPEVEAVPKPVYAASTVEWGAYRDAYERKDTYWYWSVLKKYMTYVFSSYKDITWDCSAEVEISAPCSGCSRCRMNTDHEEFKKDDTPEPLRRWWMAYLPKPQPVSGTTPDEEKVDYSSIINEDCGVLHKSTISSICDLNISTRNTPHSLGVSNYALVLKTGPPSIGVLEFIKEGWRREWNSCKNYSAETAVGEITLRPTGNTKTEKGIDRELSIDSETFEVRPMKIKMKPSAVTIFAPLSPPFNAHVG